MDRVPGITRRQVGRVENAERRRGSNSDDGQAVYRAPISPDGKTVACASPDEKAVFKWQIAIVPFDGGTVTRFIDLPDLPATANPQVIAWAPDGRSIAHVDVSGVGQNIFAQPIDGGPRKQLTNFKTNSIAAFNFTRDGKQLILGRGPLSQDVVLIKDFR